MKHKLLILLVIVSFLAAGCKKTTKVENRDENASPDQEQAKVMQVSDSKSDVASLITSLGGGQPQNEFKYIDSNFVDLESNTKSISDYNGKVIFLNLWATWCPPCREEMPSMEKLYRQFKDKDFVILAVSAGEDQKTVKKFLEKNSYTFPIFTDYRNATAGQYGTGSIPTTYIIDKKGYIVARFVGGRDWYSKEAIDLITKLVE